MYVYSQFDVESHFQGKLKIAYLNQPETLNALNKALLLELREFIEFYEKDQDTRCIVIAGKGKAFCSGQMLDEQLLDPNVNIGREVQKIVTEFYNPLVNAINYSSKPIVSLVNGLAVGAGAVLALICDFSLVSKSAYFSFGFSNIGLIPDTGGTYFLPKIMNRQMAHYLTYTGKKLSADEAKDLGIVADVFSDEDFSAKSMEMLEGLVNMPTKALGLTKKALRKSYRYSLKEQLDLESVYQAEAARSEDFKEGIDAFLEKRKPVFKGK